MLIVGPNEVSYCAKPAGRGTWREKLLAEVGAALPTARVHFLGRVPYADYHRVLQVSACHVYLHYPFVLSWICVEAMSAGCVLVGSRTAPVQELIEHGQDGLLVDFFDIPALVRQVCDVLEDPKRYLPLRQRARAKVVERYDLRSRCLPRLVDLVLGKQGG